ncbi:hypothetical protein EIP91_009390 [Steccherinum ochraceum]|uniref:F-box domain-containing protein n=1 Tax=Steccherinum ochraceum TaxID=92696 RepID=A0A4V2MV39_9APHY|nr:hypothetical protein EIP91_009390 [Steccherinum ochraceum]
MAMMASHEGHNPKLGATQAAAESNAAPEPIRVTCAHLPDELLLLMVELLSNDRFSLSSCTLVSRQWYAVSRPYIYRSIQIAGRVGLLVLHVKLKETPRMAYWIKELCIKSWSRVWELWTKKWCWKVLRKLKAVYSLKIKMPRASQKDFLSYKEQTTLIANVGKCNTIRELSLQGSVLASCALPIMRCLPRLRSLSFPKLCDIDFNLVQDLRSPASYGRCPNLTTLSIYDRTPSIFGTVLSEESLKSLETLELCDQPMVINAYHVIRILHSLGPQLRSLVMKYRVQVFLYEWDDQLGHMQWVEEESRFACKNLGGHAVEALHMS